MRTADRLRGCFRETKVLHLAFLNQFLHRSGHVLDGHIQVNTVLIEEIDGIDLQPLERGFCNLLDVFRPTVEPLPTRSSVEIEIETEFGGNDHLSAEGVACPKFCTSGSVSVAQP